MMPKNFLPWEEYIKTIGKKHCGAGGIIRNKFGEVLLEKLSYRDHWSLPGGAVDNEESPREALKRELFEELNLQLEPGNLIGLKYVSGKVSPRNLESLQFLFDCGVLYDENIVKIKVDGEEVVEYKFVKLDDLENLVGDEKKAKAIELAVSNIKENKCSYLEDC